MEGVTDEAYRLAMFQVFPEWDRHFTDFLRIPTNGYFKEKKIIEHFGNTVYHNPKLKKKTSFQILTTPFAQTRFFLEQIKELEIDHLDLNLGCPSKVVNSHFGGAYLLSDMDHLKKVTELIRDNFSKTFTVKIRAGYRDDTKFKESLKLFESIGVDGITIHGRTRDQLYKGRANWEYMKIATETVNTPIIANGDIWTLQDIFKIFKYSNCHSVMLARTALKTPWIAKIYKKAVEENTIFNEEELLRMRKKYIKKYFFGLKNEYEKNGSDNHRILGRFKSTSRNIFDDLDESIDLPYKRKFLRSKSLNEFLDHVLKI